MNTKLRALLLKNNEAGTYDNYANHEIIIALPALLDRLDKLEAVAVAADRLVYRVIGQREIQDDGLSALPISELKDTLDALE